MKIIGLTGGIASGKSAVSSVLKELGAQIICADQIARDIVSPLEPGNEAIMDTFGSEYFLPNRELDRTKLGTLVFSDASAREQLDRILHPLIIKETLNKIQNTKKDIVIIDAALLIETSLHKLVDEVWLVIAPKEVRIKRIMSRDEITREDAVKRIASQSTDAWRKQFADKILQNNGDLTQLRNKVVELYQRLQK